MVKSGFVNVIKPTGMTSSDVVIKLKKILGTKKVGHLGTLDPAASGVLPVAFGKATKFFDYFLKKDKVYIADVKFGVLTDTLDSFGSVTDRQNVNISSEDIKNVLGEFVGKIKQVPPKYSAVKINGKKACDLIRMGVEVEIKPREIDVYDIELLDELEKNLFRFKVHCSAGTYIRTLFNDIASKLGTIATTPVIIRTKSGLFEIGSAVTLSQLNEEKSIIEIDKLFQGLEKINISDNVLYKKLTNGAKLTKNDLNIENENNFLIYGADKLVGMYHFEQERLICDVFLLEE